MKNKIITFIIEVCAILLAGVFFLWILTSHTLDSHNFTVYCVDSNGDVASRDLTGMLYTDVPDSVAVQICKQITLNPVSYHVVKEI